MMKFVDHSCQYPEQTNSEKKLWQADKLAGSKKNKKKKTKKKQTQKTEFKWISHSLSPC